LDLEKLIRTTQLHLAQMMMKVNMQSAITAQLQ